MVVGVSVAGQRGEVLFTVSASDENGVKSFEADVPVEELKKVRLVAVKTIKYKLDEYEYDGDESAYWDIVKEYYGFYEDRPVKVLYSESGYSWSTYWYSGWEESAYAEVIQVSRGELEAALASSKPVNLTLYDLFEGYLEDDWEDWEEEDEDEFWF